MVVLTESNSSVDKNSGAVIFHKSPELQELFLLRKEVKELNTKMDTILNLLLKGGNKDG